MKLWRLLIILFLACGPKVEVVYFNNYQPLQKSSSVLVYTSSDLVERPFREIGLITLDDEGWGRSDAKLIERAKSEAMKCGADGIVLGQSQKVDKGSVMVSMGVAAKIQHNVINIILIKFKD